MLRIAGFKIALSMPQTALLFSSAEYCVLLMMKAIETLRSLAWANRPRAGQATRTRNGRNVLMRSS